ncbi:XrtA system polysaccharide deacetylase [Sedimenticola thiotaurini]
MSDQTRSQRLITNAMTIDVEDYFQVSAFEQRFDRSTWDQQECRVERNLETILALLERHGIKATFFTLGWIAERYPGIVRSLVEAGHELACHSYWHKRASGQGRDEFVEEVIDTKKLLEDIGGTPVIGYRAPSYSIGAGNLWAHEALMQAGYRYSSSIYPISHDHYGMPSAPRFAYHPIEDSDFLEIPITTSYIFNRRLPAGGGGYFRFFPYAFSRALLRKVNNLEQQPGIFYFHPWEIDPGQPRQQDISLKTRFRHYLNLNHTENRLNRLFADFQWGRMDQIFLSSARL